MHKLTVTRLSDGKQAVVEASHSKALMDHLEASSRRKGFDVIWWEPGLFGRLEKDGETVATWEVN